MHHRESRPTESDDQSEQSDQSRLSHRRSGRSEAAFHGVSDVDQLVYCIVNLSVSNLKLTLKKIHLIFQCDRSYISASGSERIHSSRVRNRKDSVPSRWQQSRAVLLATDTDSLVFSEQYLQCDGRRVHVSSRSFMRQASCAAIETVESSEIYSGAKSKGLPCCTCGQFGTRSKTVHHQ